MREIYMDNRYSSPFLFVLLRDKCQILACGTIRTNRKGWNTRLLNVLKSDERGKTLMKYDPTNKILFGQWKDNKFVSFISSLGVFSMSTVQRRVGAEKLNFRIPTALKLYTKDDFMGEIDNLDKNKCIGGPFTSRTMFRNWYRMGLMGILDLIIVDRRQAWLMSTVENKDRFFLTNGYFRIYLPKNCCHSGMNRHSTSS